MNPTAHETPAPRYALTLALVDLTGDTLRAKLAHELGNDQLAAAALADVERGAHELRQAINRRQATRHTPHPNPPPAPRLASPARPQHRPEE